MIRDRLRKRLPGASNEELDAIMTVLDKYDLTLTIQNLDEQGLVLFDTKGRSVRISVSEWRNQEAHIAEPATDITIVSTAGILAGWIESHKLENFEDRCIVPLKSLAPMPSDFCFDAYCSHLVDHGGFFEGENWECAGCGRLLVFNDKR